MKIKKGSFYIDYFIYLKYFGVISAQLITFSTTNHLATINQEN
jgi:hypothetical protein